MQVVNVDLSMEGIIMIEAIRKRKSIRKFQNRKVEPEKIKEILRAAMRSPSGMTGLPWEFIVIDEPQVLQSLKGFSQGSHATATAPLLIVPVIKNLEMRDKIDVHFLDYEDMGACTENIWLQAIEEGLSASWMGVKPGSNHCDLISKILQLPAGTSPFAVMAIGYAAEDVDTAPEDRYDESRVHYNHF